MHGLKCALCKRDKEISGNSSIGPICWDCYAWYELVLCLDCNYIVNYNEVNEVDGEIILEHAKDCKNA